MAEREIWEVVAERFALYKKIRGVDRFNLIQDLTEVALKGLSRPEIVEVLNAHGLKADKFFENEEFWNNVEIKLKNNE